MLLRRFIFIYFLFYSVSLCGQKMPEYNTVLRKFYSEYEKKEPSVFLEFAKTREGWKINRKTYTSEGWKQLSSDLYYNRKRGIYENVPFQKFDSVLTAEDHIRNNGYYWTLGEAYNFERCPYY